MAWGVVLVFKDSCEELTIKNASGWEMSPSKHQLVPSQSVTMAMCPRLCSDFGRCINGACKCRRGMLNSEKA